MSLTMSEMSSVTRLGDFLGYKVAFKSSPNIFGKTGYFETVTL